MKRIVLLVFLLASITAEAQQKSGPANWWRWINRNGSSAVVVPAPTDFSADPVSTTQINLSWEDVSATEDSYVIESSTSPTTGFAVIETTAADVTTYQNTGLTTGTTYYYRIKTVDGALSSSYVTTLATTLQVPTAPSSLSASAISVSQIDLSWTDNSSNENGFEIHRSLVSGSGFVAIDTASVNATSYSATGLSSSTTYYFKIKAIGSSGSSSFSNETSATTSTPVLVPADPSDLTAENGGATAVNLAWTDNSSNETGFEVHRSTTSGSGFSLIHTTAVNVTSYQNTGLSSGTTYYYKVRAVNGIGNSSFTSEASAIPTTPLAPSGLTVTLNTNPTSSTAGGTIAWTDNSSNETGFEVWRSPDSNTSFALITTTAANAVSYTETTLEEGRRYYYRVRAVNGGSASAYTSQAHDLTTWSTVITQTAEGTAASATGSSLSVTLPSNSSGQMMVIFIACKTQQVRALPPTSGEWAEGLFMLDNTNGNSTDAGPVSMAVFYKISDGSETSPVVFPIINSPGVAYGKCIVFGKDANAFWSLDVSGGAHNTAATTSYSAISWEKMTLNKGDVMFVANGLNGNNITYLGQALAHSNTSGSSTSFTETTEEIFESGTSDGNDVGLNASLYTVATNTTVNGKATFTMTGNTSSAGSPIGVTGFIRLRNARTLSTSVTTPFVAVHRGADLIDVVAGSDGSTFGDGLRVNSFGSDAGTKKYSVETFNGRQCMKVLVDFTMAGTDATVNYRSELHTNPWLPNYPIGTQLIMEWKFETDANATASPTDWLPFQLHPGTPPGSGFSSNSPQLSLAFTFAGQTGFDNAVGAATAGQLSFINFVDDPTIANTPTNTKQYIRNRYTGYDWEANSIYRIRLHYRADVITGDPVLKLWASKNGGAMTLLYEDYSYPTVYLTTDEAGSTPLVMGTPKFGVYHHGVKTEVKRQQQIAAGHDGVTMFIPCMKQIILLPNDANYFTDYTNNSATIYDLVDTSTE